MVMMINQNCNCCINPAFDFFHCKFCWNKWHNGERDNDWLDAEKYRKQQPSEIQKLIELMQNKAVIKKILNDDKELLDELAKS